MSSKQKLVLAVLGILDLVVIIAMGAVVVRSRQELEPQAAIPTTDPCTAALLTALAGFGRGIAVDWGEEAARVMLTIETPVPGLPQEQHLWLALDAFPAPLPATCPTPKRVTLAILLQDDGAHTAELDGRHLTAWLAGTESDADLAAHARYRSRP